MQGLHLTFRMHLADIPTPRSSAARTQQVPGRPETVAASPFAGITAPEAEDRGREEAVHVLRATPAPT